MNQENKKYRMLMVGCGTISNEWLRALDGRDDCELVAMMDINPEAAKKQQEKYGISCPIYTDLDTALAEVKPDIVIDLAYGMAHCEITLKCLEAGCHVFGEKPMCMNREEALRMIEAVKKSGLTFNVMQNRRFLPGIRALRHAVSSGMLGEICMVCCEIYVGSDLKGERNLLPYPMLQDQAIHSFDSARFILGTDAKNVYCHSYNPPGSRYNGDGSGACIFEMENGTVLVYNAVMDTYAFNTCWHSQWRITGTKGTAVWQGLDYEAMPYEGYVDLPEAEFRKEDGSRERIQLKPPADWDGIEWFKGSVNEMLTALKEGRESISSYTTNYGSVFMTFAAMESAKSGQRVDIENI